MVTIEAIKRKFILELRGDEIVLPDIGDSFTPEDVKSHYSNQYPELINSSVEIEGINEDNENIIKFKTISGTKG